MRIWRPKIDVKYSLTVIYTLLYIYFLRQGPSLNLALFDLPGLNPLSASAAITHNVCDLVLM